MGQEKRPGQYYFQEKPLIEGLTPELASNLYDIAIKWGKVNPEDAGVRFRSGDMGLGYEILLTTTTDPRSRNLFVAKTSTPRGGIEIIRSENNVIFWDKTLSSDEAKKMVTKLDENAKSAGLIDPKTNERKPLPPKLSLEDPRTVKYNVDEVFSKPGGAFMVPPGKDPQKYLDKFDHPEKLVITRNPLGGTMINLAADVQYLEKRARIAEEIFRKRGIDPRDIIRLKPKDIFEIRKEIEERLNETDK